jgi:hypothetical protein
MKRLDQRRDDAFARALQYIAENALVPAVPRATALFTELGTIRTGMQADAALQATGLTGFRGGAAERKQAYFSLYDEMRVLNTIARSLPKAEFPDTAEQFRLPRSRSYAAITAYARAFATHATANEAIFTDRGLAAGFVAAFTAKTDAAEAAVGIRHTGLMNRSGGTAGLAAKGSRGVAILRELDGIMKTALRNDPVLLGKWKTARRIARSEAEASAAPPPNGGDSATVAPPSGS